jgi:hypothetical protein
MAAPAGAAPPPARARPPARLLGAGRYAVQQSLGSGSSGEAFLCAPWPPAGGAGADADADTVVIKQVGPRLAVWRVGCLI